jgi:predicted Zn-dependent protease
MLALAALLLGGCQAAMIDERDEKPLGRNVALTLTNRYPVSQDPMLNDYVTRIGLVLGNVTDRPDLEVHAGALRTREVGAWAGPGGYILITEGAIGMMDDESELAGVLAHELAHAVLKHGLDAVKQESTKQEFLALMSLFKETSKYVEVAAAATDVVISKPYSRDQERAADAAGVKYLIAAGYDPNGLLKFLQKLQRTKGAAAGGQMLSTHPGLDERISNVRNLIAQAGSPGGARLKDRFVRNTAGVVKTGVN